MTDDAADTGRTASETTDDAPESERVDSMNPEGTTSGESISVDATEPDDVDESVATDVIDRVAEYDEELAEDVREQVVSRQTELAAAERQLDEQAERIGELESTVKRVRADFQNYKKRAKKRQDQLRERATEDFVERIVTVRDNLVRALEQDESGDIRGGLESTLEEFDRILEDENVTVIEPDAGADVDPQRHEVMMRVESDHPDDTVADVYQHGYEMGDRVIRAAQITVSKSDGE